MKISYNWLKWYIPDAPDANKLADVITYHLTEVEGMEKLPDGDTVLDINILPNRAHDLLSHSGVGRELAGQLDIPFTDPTKTYTDIMAKKEIQKTKLSIDVNTEDCRRFTARIVRNIKVGPSPEWVVKHLESIGSRTINNIVDATNLVMFNCGQPTHAFDLRKFSDEKIVIKNAKDNDELKLVGRDGIVAKLKEIDIVIANNAGETLSLAGIKGGVNSGVADDTTDILLEVANFNPTSIRKTARRIGVLSDSAKRFENDLSPELCTFAMLELTALICEMCPDAVVEEVVGYYPNPQTNKTISFTTEFVNKKVGGNIADEDIEKILKNYNFEYTKDSGNFVLNVPSLRLDLETPTDMAEEIGRIYGYDKLNPTLPQIGTKSLSGNEIYEKILAVRSHLLNEGYREVMTYAFGKKGEVEVLASASDKNFLRTNLTDGLKASFEMNRLNAPLLGIDTVKIFEIGTVFKKDKEEIHVGYANKKEVKEITLDEYVTNNNLDYKDSKNIIDKIEPGMFNPWSVYPFITRDLSLWVNNDSDKDIVLEIIKEAGKELLIKDPQILDRFEKEGKISYAFRMVFQSYERTLSDDEINKIMEQINQKVVEKGYIPR